MDADAFEFFFFLPLDEDDLLVRFVFEDFEKVDFEEVLLIEFEAEDEEEDSFFFLLFDLEFGVVDEAAFSGSYSIANCGPPPSEFAKPSMRRKALFRNSGKHARTTARMARRRLLMKSGSICTIFFSFFKL